MCQICIRDLYDTVTRYNFSDVGVHHITPLNEDLKRGLDNTNLLSVCEYHHKRCEVGGDIPRDEQFKIAQEQEDKTMGWS
jgi:hypothetical protein